jgi:hypothetical protein
MRVFIFASIRVVHVYMYVCEHEKAVCLYTAACTRLAYSHVYYIQMRAYSHVYTCIQMLWHDTPQDARPDTWKDFKLSVRACDSHTSLAARFLHLLKSVRPSVSQALNFPEYIRKVNACASASEFETAAKYVIKNIDVRLVKKLAKEAEEIIVARCEEVPWFKGYRDEEAEAVEEIVHPKLAGKKRKWREGDRQAKSRKKREVAPPSRPSRSKPEVAPPRRTKPVKPR